MIQYTRFFLFTEEHISRNQKKRQRKAAKKLLEKLNEETHKKAEHVVETRDPLTILKEKLSEAKEANVRLVEIFCVPFEAALQQHN